MVFTLILGVVNEAPVPNEVPPVEAAYQLSVPPVQPVAPNITVPVPQREFGPAPGASGIALIVANTGVLGETQSPIVQDT